MDREHAKFILQSFRSDGADANDEHFAEALQLAAEDRELGAWLADERANDALFTDALGSVNIPEGLREEIIAVLEHDAGTVDSGMDGVFVGALASITPPAGLRDQILSAMEVEKQAQEPSNVTKFPIPMKWLNIAAVAAVVVLGAVFMFPNDGDEVPQQVALHEIQLQSGSMINASHELEFEENSLENANQWLVSHGLPQANTVPRGLITNDTKIAGGRKLVMSNGVEASMIYFKKKDIGDFYLMVLEADSVTDLDEISNMNEISLKACSSCPLNHFTVTSWKDKNKVYMLLSKEKGEVVVKLF